MPRNTKPVTVAQYNQAVCSVSQRVQGAMRMAEPGQMAGLWDSWPQLAAALVALDLELRTPVQPAYGLPHEMGR